MSAMPLALRAGRSMSEKVKNQRVIDDLQARELVAAAPVQFARPSAVRELSPDRHVGLRTPRAYRSRTLVSRALRAVLIASTLGAPDVSSAHPALVTSSPRSGEVVASAPKELVLRFNEPIEASFTHIELLDATNTRRDVHGLRSNAQDPNSVAVTLPTLVSGAYKARWSVVGRDGHRIKGEFTFTVR